MKKTGKVYSNGLSSGFAALLDLQIAVEGGSSLAFRLDWPTLFKSRRLAFGGLLHRR